jgi:glycosyltransferase involved in cell wall biosynthesis
LLVAGFRLAGHEVKLATLSQGGGGNLGSNDVLRVPRWWGLLKAFFWADVLLQNHLSIRLSWPIFFWRKPNLFVHHDRFPAKHERSIRRLVLMLLCRRGMNAAVSQYVAESLPLPSRVMLNPIRHSYAYGSPGSLRNDDVLFLGRLVPYKRVNDLLAAFSILKQRGRTYRLTVIGDGPERSALETIARDHQLEHLVTFVGRAVGSQLEEYLLCHKLMVVPSDREAFGLVALEGIAAGLVPIGTLSGGLPEAVGNCGPLVPVGDPSALADAITTLMESPALRLNYLTHANVHLMHHDSEVVANNYLNWLTEIATPR